ncbi:MAG: hypothetical protein WCR55_14045 [Lentisphaerota bacterium]
MPVIKMKEFKFKADDRIFKVISTFQDAGGKCDIAVFWNTNQENILVEKFNASSEHKAMEDMKKWFYAKFKKVWITEIKD